eukprot:TRINITY_DN1889_c0_g1_i5.p1 TRINITY_DN1889_c0_g1~~TRINITY_DN1889_c0_g1_i5.p1  ORF type:complete len:236 (+),score=37.03 TRINITY_DN1889_c0_g1_i5:103-708(+)
MAKKYMSMGADLKKKQVEAFSGQNYDGYVDLAASTGNPHILYFLKENGITEFTTRNKHGVDPLIKAAACPNTKVFQFLIENKCDINGQTNLGTTALMRCCMKLSKEGVIMLLKLGADPEITDHNGETALDKAKSSCHHFHLFYKNTICKWSIKTHQMQPENLKEIVKILFLARRLKGNIWQNFPKFVLYEILFNVPLESFY